MITNYIFNLLKAETYTESDQGVTASILICRTTVSRAKDWSSIYRNYNHTGCMRRTLLTKTMLDNPHHCPSVSRPATCFTPTDDPTESACVCWINQHGRNQSSFSFFRFLNSFFTLVFYFVAFFYSGEWLCYKRNLSNRQLSVMWPNGVTIDFDLCWSLLLGLLMPKRLP